MEASGEKLASGSINTEEIRNTHQKIKEIVARHVELSNRVAETTHKVKASWEGEGRFAFESQYKILISEIEDLSEILAESYEALVKSEGEFVSLDDEIKLAFEKTISEMEG